MSYYALIIRLNLASNSSIYKALFYNTLILIIGGGGVILHTIFLDV